MATSKKRGPASAGPVRVTLRFGTTPLTGNSFPFLNLRTANEDVRAKLLAWSGSEADLIRYASQLTNGRETPTTIARDGALARAKYLITTIEGLHGATTERSGVLGAADSRLTIARDQLLERGLAPAEIKPTMLGKTAVPPVNFRTAVRFIAADPILKGAGNRNTRRAVRNRQG